jgi:hypothetical protein
MNRYRLFFTDDLTRRILSSIEFEAADEAKALAYAEARRATSSMELWAKGGLIKRWESFSAND